MTVAATAYLGFKKPTYVDPADVLILNQNWDQLDGMFGSLPDPNRKVFFGGPYTGLVESIGVGIGHTLYALPDGDAAGAKINSVIHSTSAGPLNGNLMTLEVQPEFHNHGFGAKNLMGIFCRSYDVSGQGFTRAIGIVVDSPIGAAVNWSIQNSGNVQMRGAGVFYFQRVDNVTDAILGTASGANVYVPGTAGGDLVIRTEAGLKLVASVDGGATAGLVLASTGMTLAVPLRLPAGVTGAAPLRLPHGVAPTSPVDGDLWTTSAGLFARINGVTVGPLS